MSKGILVLTAASLFIWASCTSKEEIKRKQYYIEGERLYGLYCANCHQPDGEGLVNLYPPLHFLRGKNRLIQIVKHGIDKEIEVNGVTYHRPMPANLNLTDLEIAQITTYIYNRWGEENTYTRIDSVKRALDIFPETDLR